MEAGAGGDSASLRHDTGHRRGCSTLHNIDRRAGRVMTLLPPGVKVLLAVGYVDMRKGIDGLAILVQGVLRQDPFSGHLFVFRGRTKANLIKIVFWDRAMSLHQAARAWRLPVAPRCRAWRDAIADLDAALEPHRRR
jgi:transposase